VTAAAEGVPGPDDFGIDGTEAPILRARISREDYLSRRGLFVLREAPGRKAGVRFAAREDSNGRERPAGRGEFAAPILHSRRETESVHPPTAAAATTPADGGQYLTFLLGNEEYAFDILQVQEIKGLPRITPVPNVPAHVRGVMNLRGVIVPVADLRVRFALPEAADARSAVVVVASVAGRTVGLIVDAVSDVLSFRAEDVEPVPDLGAGPDASVVMGLAKAGERLVLLLDLGRLLATTTPLDVAADAA